MESWKENDLLSNLLSYVHLIYCGLRYSAKGICAKKLRKS